MPLDYKPGPVPQCDRCGQLHVSSSDVHKCLPIGPLEQQLRAAIAEYRPGTGYIPEIFWARERTVIELFKEVGLWDAEHFGSYGYNGLSFIHRDCVPEGVFVVGRRCETCYGRGYIEPHPPWHPMHVIFPCPHPDCEAPK